MRTAPIALKQWLPTTNVCWRADLITITLLSGAVYRWTTANVDLAYGGFIYSAGPVLSRRMRQSSRGEIDRLDLQMASTFQVNAQSVSLLALQGFFDDARVKIDHVVGAYPGDLSFGPIPSWFEGRVSGVDPGSLELRLSVASELETLNIQLPRFAFSLSCGHVVYDANCGVAKAAYTLTGAVVASPAPTAQVLGTTQTSRVDGYFALGVLTFTSGALSGTRRAVRGYTQSGGLFTLALPLPSAPAVGDAFSVFPGCPRTYAACQSQFNNLAAFRGFPHLPVPESAL